MEGARARAQRRSTRLTPFPHQQHINEHKFNLASIALLGAASAVLTMYLCCRAVSVKRIEWRNLTIKADPTSVVGYIVSLQMHQVKTGAVGADTFSVMLYPNTQSALDCPLVWLSIIVLLFADELRDVGDAAGAWQTVAMLGELAFDDGDEEDDAGDADDGILRDRAYVLPRVAPGGRVDFSKMNSAGFAALFTQFCEAGGLGPVHLTGHSFRNMAHTFAYMRGLSDDDLRKFAVWLNKKVAAGAELPLDDDGARARRSCARTPR